MALALVRYEFFGRRAANFLIVIPMATPEIVMGASLLSLFLIYGLDARVHDPADRPRDVLHQLRRGRRALAPDRLRPQPGGGGPGPRAPTPFTTFRLVTLPLIMPGVVGGALLAFALSIDDFVVSNFNSGTTVTFPLYIFGAAQRGIPVEVNVIATMLFMATVTRDGARGLAAAPRRADGGDAPEQEARSRSVASAYRARRARTSERSSRWRAQLGRPRAAESRPATRA